MKNMLLKFLSLISLAAFPAAAQPVFADPSFATPALGACPNLVQAPPGVTWTFVNSAGITTGGCNLKLTAPAIPSIAGTQAGFLQAGPYNGAVSTLNTASMSQTVSGFQTGHSYNINFYGSGQAASAAGLTYPRSNLSVSITVGTTDVLDFTATSTTFQSYTTKTFTATGSVEITFAGTGPVGFNCLAFITLLSIQDLGTTSTSPSISSNGVVSASAFGGFTSVSPGSWVEIYGSNLASDTRGWAQSDFNGVNAPTSLDGTSVSIGGQAAFVDYISPGQVNALVPSNVATGPQSMTVKTAAGTSAAYNILVNAIEPGLLATPTFNVNGTPYAVALFSDGTYVLPTGAVAGLSSRPAKPGDTIILYGVGFGPVTPSIPAGQLAEQSNAVSGLQMSIGGVPAVAAYAGLAPGYTGLYQFNLVVPNVAVGNAVPLTFTLGGTAGTQKLNIAVGN
jgi:uncharacterized protein (TIGR03437 family)